MEKDRWYAITNIDALDSPALVVYPDRVEKNISVLVSMVDDVKRLRPHVKTHKTKEATLLMMATGINKFKCATIAEAEMLAICGAADVLLAYQPVGPKVARLADLIKHYPATKFSCLTDNIAAATEMDAVYTAAELSVPVYIDLNVGMNRTGILPASAVDLYLACSNLKGIVPVGLHAYDGHIRDADLFQRKVNCDAAFRQVELVQQQITDSGLPTPVIIAGGSPTFSIHCKRSIIECSPGTFVFWDKGYSDLCPEQPFLPAALVVTRIISMPAPTKLCLDLGHKSIAAENELGKRVYFLNAPALVPVGQSEEHLVVETVEGHNFKIGDTLYALPVHICPTIALHERAYAIEKGKINGEWRILARDRKIGC